VPKDTPEDIRQAISDVMSQISADPGFKAKMDAGGFIALDIGYEDMAGFMSGLGEEYTAVGQALGLVQ
jgi:tripartite-type tricarboxylate transporter receptor subunit TctC